MPEHLTSESESGSWPTIRSTDAERGGRGDLIQAVRGNQNSHFRLWQTPVADDAVNREAGKINSRGEPKLSAQVKLWPTITVCGNYNKKGASKKSGDGLATAVATCPTPRSRDWKDTGTVPPSRVIDPGKDSLGQWVARTEPGGSLNPTWVEWLMGWPLGWTDSAHSGMDKFRQWLRSHGKF